MCQSVPPGRAGFRGVGMAPGLHRQLAMRATTVLAAVVMGSCGGGPAALPDAGSASICGELPADCEGRCTTMTASFDFSDCCDSLTCNCNPASEAWELQYCDPQPPPDAAVDGGADAASDADPLAPDAGWACGDPPPECAGRCLTQVDNFQYENCCDSVTCNCDPSTLAWEAIFCDPPLDAGL